jgi:NAD(P)-dependent dehydrogenase (short-subunit alcohol dehydrogenase family)
MKIPTDYVPAIDALKDRVILITGAGDGLGRAAALSCARHGATVVLLGRTVSKLESTYDSIRAAGGAEPAIYPLNLTGASWNDYLELAVTLERELSRLDGILHCAAHFKEFSPLSSVDPKDWIESMQVNLTAPFALMRACLALMEKSRGASVVFVADTASRSHKPYQGAYGISKCALEALMHNWAAELPSSSGIRLNSFYPGPMRTALRRRGFPGEHLDEAPLPDSAVPSLLWLLSNDSRGVSGQAF